MPHILVQATGTEAEAEDFEEFGENPDTMSEGYWLVVESKLLE